MQNAFFRSICIVWNLPLGWHLTVLWGILLQVTHPGLLYKVQCVNKMCICSVLCPGWAVCAFSVMACLLCICRRWTTWQAHSTHQEQTCLVVWVLSENIRVKPTFHQHFQNVQRHLEVLTMLIKTSCRQQLEWKVCYVVHISGYTDTLCKVFSIISMLWKPSAGSEFNHILRCWILPHIGSFWLRAWMCYTCIFMPDSPVFCFTPQNYKHRCWHNL